MTLIHLKIKHGIKYEIIKTIFGKMPDGKVAYLYTLHNDNGMIIRITNYGAIITSVIT